MNDVFNVVKSAQKSFRSLLVSLGDDGGLTLDRYTRFLSMQYHLTKGVQRHFMSIAANPATAKKKLLRNWLIGFAQEEEFHFDIAKSDLKELGKEPLSCPFDTELWWCYFNSIIETRPFVRLGATCILENIADGSSDVLDSMIHSSSFLNKSNLKFLTIHRHGPNLAHGEQVLEALKHAHLTSEELEDVVEGAKKGAIMYMRLAFWIAHGSELGAVDIESV